MVEAEAGSHRGTRRPGLLLVLVLTVVLIPLSRAEAFPIEPRTLWELTQQAHLRRALTWSKGGPASTGSE